MKKFRNPLARFFSSSPQKPAPAPDSEIHRLEIKLRHLNNEIQLVKQEYDEARTNYFTIYSHMEKIVDERTAELRTLQHTLEQKGRELQIMIDMSPQIIFYIDDEHRFLRVNRHFAETAGHPIEEIPGKLPRDIFPRKTASFLNRGLKAILRGSPMTNQAGHLETPGGTKPVIMNRFPFRDEKGKTAGVIGFIQDLSEIEEARAEKRALQERVYRAEKMEAIGLLAGGVAHDSNNIIGGIIGYIDLVLMDLPEGHPHREYLKEALNSANEMSELVQDLLTMSRRGMEEKIVVDINQTIANFMTSSVIMEINEKYPELEIITSLSEELNNVYGAPVSLNKILNNLTINAAEATAEGQIIIKTENVKLDTPRQLYDSTLSPGRYVSLAVEDTGSGISQEDLAHIFEPFYTKKRMGRSGTGLGLAVVYGTVKELGGHIDIQSAPGRGTLFQLFFPATAKATDTQEETQIIQAIQGKGEKILIIDDERTQREIAQAILKKMRYKPKGVASGEEALQEMEKTSYDLIVLDMIMDPGMDGLETYQKILEINPRQKALIVTGYSQTGRMDRCLRLGRTDYIHKPLALEKLARAVYELLNN